ncbi:hypothetical protein Hanom_Chr03g00258131 [Helianthus anomalus]
MHAGREIGEGVAEREGCSQQSGKGNRGCLSGRVHHNEGERRWWATLIFNQSTFFLFFFFLNKKTIPLRGECHHQIGVREEFKRGVDVA